MKLLKETIWCQAIYLTMWFFFKVMSFRGFSFIPHSMLMEWFCYLFYEWWQWRWDRHMASAFTKMKEVLPRRQQRKTFWAEPVYLKNKHLCSNAFTSCLISDYFKKHPNLIKLIFSSTSAPTPCKSLGFASCLCSTWQVSSYLEFWPLEVGARSLGCEPSPSSTAGVCEPRYCSSVTHVQRTASHLSGSSW